MRPAQSAFLAARRYFLRQFFVLSLSPSETVMYAASIGRARKDEDRKRHIIRSRAEPTSAGGVFFCLAALM